MIYAFSSNVDKVAVNASAPLFYGFALVAVMVLILTPITLLRQPDALRILWGESRALGLLGLVNGLMILCHMTAISLAIVPYVIAVKRTSTLLSVLWGGWLLGEAGLRQRLTGAAVMFAGLLLIVLPG